MEQEKFAKKPKLEKEEQQKADAAPPARTDQDDDDDDEVQVIEGSASSLLSPGIPAWITIHTQSPQQDDDDELSDTIQVVGTRNAQALPHMRQHCTVHPYEMEQICVDKHNNTSPNLTVCDLCYCYVCDVPVKDCASWSDHCDATDASAYWKHQRQQSKRMMDNKLIEFELKEAKVFRILATMMKEFLIGCIIHFDRCGMEINELDVSQVVLLDCRLSREMFSKYEIQDDEVLLGLSEGGICNLSNGMSRTKKTDTMTLRANQSRLAVDFENEKFPDKAPASFQLNLESDRQSTDLEISGYYSALIKMPSALFRKTVQDLHKVLKGSSVTIAVSRTEVSFRTRDLLAKKEGRPGIWSGRIRYRSSHDGIDIDCDRDEFELHLDMKLLLKAAKASMITPVVVISLEPERPVAIEYPLSSGVLRFHIAPRIAA